MFIITTTPEIETQRIITTTNRTLFYWHNSYCNLRPLAQIHERNTNLTALCKVIVLTISGEECFAGAIKREVSEQ